MQTVLIVIHLMIVSAMIGLVLLQKSEGGGLGMGGGGGGFLTSRGTSNVLTRTTASRARSCRIPPHRPRRPRSRQIQVDRRRSPRAAYWIGSNRAPRRNRRRRN